MTIRNLFLDLFLDRVKACKAGPVLGNWGFRKFQLAVLESLGDFTNLIDHLDCPEMSAMVSSRRILNVSGFSIMG